RARAPETPHAVEAGPRGPRRRCARSQRAGASPGTERLTTGEGTPMTADGKEECPGLRPPGTRGPLPSAFCCQAGHLGRRDAPDASQEGDARCLHWLMLTAATPTPQGRGAGSILVPRTNATRPRSGLPEEGDCEAQPVCQPLCRLPYVSRAGRGLAPGS